MSGTMFICVGEVAEETEGIHLMDTLRFLL